jgi:uncharacterized membrane protein
MGTTTSNDDQALRRAFFAVAACGVVLSIVVGFFFGWKLFFGALVGAFVAVANLWLLARTVQKLLAPTGAKAQWALLAVTKFVALLGCVYFLVSSDALSPLGLAIGFGALPLGIVFAGAVGVRHGEETDHA